MNCNREPVHLKDAFEADKKEISKNPISSTAEFLKKVVNSSNISNMVHSVSNSNLQTNIRTKIISHGNDSLRRSTPTLTPNPLSKRAEGTRPRMSQIVNDKIINKNIKGIKGEQKHFQNNSEASPKVGAFANQEIKPVQVVEMILPPKILEPEYEEVTPGLNLIVLSSTKHTEKEYDPFDPISEYIPLYDENNPKEYSFDPEDEIAVYTEKEDPNGPLGKYLGYEGDRELDFFMKFEYFDQQSCFKLEDWVFMETLGETSHSTTKKVYHREQLTTFAFRTIVLDKINNDLTDIKMELKVMKLLTEFPHKHIIKLICSKLLVASKHFHANDSVSGYHLYADHKDNDDTMMLNMVIVSDLCIGSVREIAKLRKTLSLPWSELELISLIKCISGALAHAETLGIAHRNLKPSNILLSDDKLTYKLIDLKSCLILEPGKKIVKANIVGTPRYMSPEMKNLYEQVLLKESTKFTLNYDPFLSDVYSLGILTLELIFDHINSEKEVKVDTETAPKLLKNIASTYPNVFNVLTKMICIDPRTRSRFAHITLMADIALQNIDENKRIEVYIDRYELGRKLEKFKFAKLVSETPEKLLDLTKAYIKLFANENQENKTEEKFNLTKTGGNGKQYVDKAQSPIKAKNRSLGLNAVLGSKQEECIIRVLSYCLQHLLNLRHYYEAIDMNIILFDLFFKKYQTKSNHKIGCIYNCFGIIYQSLQLYEESKMFYTNSMQSMRDAFGGNSLEELKAMSNFGGCLLQKGDVSQSLEALYEALSLKQSLYKNEVESIGISQFNIGSALYKSGKATNSEEIYQKALKIFLERFGDVSIYASKSLTVLGIIFYEYKGEPVKGKELLNRAFETFRALASINKALDWTIGIGYYNIAKYHYFLGNHEKAYEYLRKALKSIEEHCGPDDMKSNLRKILENQGQSEVPSPNPKGIKDEENGFENHLEEK